MPSKKTKPEAVKTPAQRNFNSGYTVGLNLISSVVVGMAIGYGIDHFFDTKPAFFLLFMFLGIAAGFRSIWYFINAQPPAKLSSTAGEADGDDPGEGRHQESSEQRDDQ